MFVIAFGFIPYWPPDSNMLLKNAGDPVDRINGIAYMQLHLRSGIVELWRNKADNRRNI